MSTPLKPGYKQTEVGVIPDEWRVRPLGEVVDFLDGRRRPVKDSDRAKMRGDIPYYGASGIVDYVNDFLFDEDLILLGEDGENILSRNCRLAFKISGKTWVNNHAHVLRPRSGMTLEYLTEFLESRDYAQYNTGTAQPKLNKLVCSGIPVLCPPPEEQRAIAEAMGDVDALLVTLTQLIAKKRDLKQAAMQQLLTGRQRLPGFSDTWDHVSLGSLGTWLSGGTPRMSVDQYWSGDIPWASPKDMKVTRLRDTIDHVSVSALGNGTRLVPTGAILIVVRGMILAHSFPVARAERALAFNQDMRALVVKDGIDSDFVLWWLIAKRDLLLSKTSESTHGTKRMPTETLFGIKIPLPRIAEQSAIAAVLSDMDEELAALERRLAKTRALKQGMMQELLTGRTRLV